MGIFIAKLFSHFRHSNPARVVMVGLDAAGKTTILYRAKLNETVLSNATLGFNVEKLEIEGLNLTLWDVGGQRKLRDLWQYYYEGANALIYVVDCADRNRISCKSPERCIECARCELANALASDFLSTVPVLIFANKQDIPGSAKPDEIAQLLGVADFPSSRKWHIQGCCAVTGQGILDGFRWLAANIS
ncbi:Arf1j [Monocercomonoides exilis]|uniref:Arf1j n=1 Tax=Monocercomonoides exilis TaxID=2049356 RepID=UPI003559D80B|nr:Arf1j [Monocercomonoides exilis]|eukprot:MONOS_2554.1-p1 / transcript=MONOS_2554.1 / gene=MONOS_2554 / organism=Monocercomonoides_exilis_PA203 / gene_product=Arf1j / transcript_product=Arf1j / location=Mono_scaffold00053:121252-121914(+) / protein_length=189 / sequence_SO=supercontig / SO=protein_coding / is_pseudo=false